MKKQKVLININNLDEINEYKKIGINNFLFALEGFSIGYNSFELNDIPKESFILINRVLDSNDIDNLKLIKDDLVKYKGIIFEDLGVYQIFKDSDIDLIWNQAHFGTNLSSINIWLDKVSSAVISNEITKNEITDIVSGVKKPVVFNVFGKNMIMYSRRTLLSNFNK
jgi:collagenase-like PrtC family protease